jgi:hypothetical protein
MSNTSTFNILQYNVRNDRVIIIISLLIDSRIKNYDIIVIQKFWRNFFDLTMLNFSQSDFHLLYRSRENIRVCFYVNEKINLNNWEMNYSSADMIFLTIQVRIENCLKTIHVHNIYNLFFLLYSLTESFSMLSKIRRHLINCQNHQILLNDFNLHHSLWNEFTRLTQHAATN